MCRRGNKIRSSADLIGAVLFSPLRREKISSELAVRQAPLVGGHVRFTSEHGTSCSKSPHQV
jgi:hypothetical protein